MLESLFLKVLELSLTASLVILAVLLIRCLLRRAPKVFSYALWAVVLFRLLCPITIQSPIGLVPGYSLEKGNAPAAELTDGNTLGERQKEEQAFSPIGTMEVPAYADEDRQGTTGAIRPSSGAADDGDIVYQEGCRSVIRGLGVKIGSVVWAAGVMILAVYSVISLVRLRKKTACSLHLRENIYLVDHISTPFVCGLLRPRIYLPSDLEGEEREYIVMHERHHIRRLDPLVKLLAFLALCVHWFNPLVWLAFILLGKDMEMSCDEAVMRHMDADIRAQYSALLLRFATGKHIIAGAPLAFGEGSPESRIRNVMNYKKPQFWVGAAAFAVCVIAGVCLLTNMSAAGETGTDEADTQQAGYEDTEQAQTGDGKSQVENVSEAGISWDERRAFVAECLERVTAERLRAVTDGLSISQEGDRTATREQRQAWETLEDNYFRIGEAAEGDAALYGLYGGDAMVLRVEDQVYPIDLDWTNMHRVFPEFYAADYDGDKETEYVIVRLTETGTGCSVQTLHVAEVDGKNCRLAEFQKEDWIEQLKRVTWEFDEQTQQLQIFSDGEETYCRIDLNDYLDGKEFTFHGVTWGDINTFYSAGSRLYLSATAGIDRGTPGSMVYDYNINLTSQVAYQRDGSFQLVGKISCNFCPPVEMPKIDWTRFSYGGVEFDLADHHKDIKYIDSCRQVGKHFLLTAVGTDTKNVFVVFDPKSCKIEKEIEAWRMTWHDDDITTAVYVRGRKLYAYDGAKIAEIELAEYEYVDHLIFTEDHSGVRVVIRSPEREIVVPVP